MLTKFIFVTGGVASSLGKGITCASIGMLLESRGLKIALLKLDPYLNVDPGTMNPYQHGEVYVTDDGAETDLDLGHYYRYTNSPISKLSNATSGQVYESVIEKERSGSYLGQTVQVIPHITNEIKKRILRCSKQEKNIQVVIVEIGGTIGDIECQPFLEAIRQFRNEKPKDCVNIHLTYVPYLKAAKEIKTKPSQHSAMMLRQAGIIPDIILCRSEKKLSQEIKEKISLFCSVEKKAVIDEQDVEKTIYEVPLQLFAQNLDTFILEKLDLPKTRANLTKWKQMVSSLSKRRKKVRIGIVGKYIDHHDAYKSIFESLHHAALDLNIDLEIASFEAGKIKKENELKGCKGYLVPGGFGERGWLGKILTAKYCREKQIPYFGICLGMQIMVLEFARNVLGLKEAHSTEVKANAKHPVISLMEEQKKLEKLGGTMRLGAYFCEIKKNTLAAKAYRKKIISERHRHRFEFNHTYQKRFEKNGMIFSGKLKGKSLCEIAEIKNHPWMLGVQYHPEFQSKPLHPHPLFKHFLSAALKQ